MLPCGVPRGLAQRSRQNVTLMCTCATISLSPLCIYACMHVRRLRLLLDSLYRERVYTVAEGLRTTTRRRRGILLGGPVSRAEKCHDSLVIPRRVVHVCVCVCVRARASVCGYIPLSGTMIIRTADVCGCGGIVSYARCRRRRRAIFSRENLAREKRCMCRIWLRG